MRPLISHGEWRRFSRTALDRRPFHWPGVGRLTSSQDLFHAIADVRTTVEDGLAGTQLRFFSGRGAENNPDNWLCRADGSCDGYRRRIEKWLRGGEYLLIASGMQVSFDLWAQLADFLRGLFSITGISPYTVQADSFMGNYRSTAFGVHRDSVGVLMSVIEGRKRMRVWQPDELDPEEVKEHGQSYRPLLKRAVTIDASPGDLVYWPARFWHVGESAGYSLTLHIALGTHGGTTTNPTPEGTPAERITSAVHDILVKRLGDNAKPLPLMPSRGDPMRDFRFAIRILSGVNVSSIGLGPVLVGRYLSRITAVGFDPPPLPRLRSGLRHGDGLRVDPRCRVLWQRLSGTLVVSANGHAFTAPFHRKLIGLLRRINAGARVHVEDTPSLNAPRSAGRSSYAALVNEVLGHLYRLRAMRRIRKI